MSPACLMAGAAVLHLASPGFILSWTHSVEKVTWRETWAIEERGLRLVSSAVRGSGAGMEPGPDAVLRDGWWISPGGLGVPELVLAASGKTGSGWTLCSGATCHEIGATRADPLRLAPCGPGRSHDARAVAE